MRNRFLAALVLLSHQAIADRPTAAASQRPGYQVIDLMPEFWRFWAAAERATVKQQAELFTKTLVARHPEVYAASVIGLDTSKPLAEALTERYEKWRSLIGTKLPVMRRVSAQIAADLSGYGESFRQALPDMRYTGKVYFMPSLGGFDGATRQVNGKRTLLFGVDMIAYIYGGDADPRPFFHHELFHIYQAQFQPQNVDGLIDQALWRALWQEGLAEYAAKVLNPSAAGLMLFGLPVDMPERAQRMLPQLARELLDNMDSTSEQEYAKFFLGNSERGDAPPRAGYYVGYLIAQRIGAGRKLADLAKVTGPELRRLVREQLVQLAAPPR
jgi:hypothetical protein